MTNKNTDNASYMTVATGNATIKKASLTVITTIFLRRTAKDPTSRNMKLYIILLNIVRNGR